jgi:3-hydroxyisobutyrate dehydrogenase-like beta-hydroxyacid dehydrogenase
MTTIGFVGPGSMGAPLGYQHRDIAGLYQVLARTAAPEPAA